MTKLKIGISIGDLNGIGPEVVLKGLLDNRICELCTPIIFASKKLCNYYLKTLNINGFNFNSTNSLEKIKNNQVNVLEVWEEEVQIEPGIESKVAGEYAYKSLSAAGKALKEGLVDALVTAPINKNAIQSEAFNFPGHTEYLENLDDSHESLMLMVSDSAKIGVVTGHIPHKEVHKKLSTELILKKITILNKSLKEDFKIRRPTIAIMGLNPHAGDNGLLGNEEKEIITPAIQQAKTIDILPFGPYAADGFFAASNYNKFDGILAMYHDQGLIPSKYLSFGQGVNYTAGLSFVRTSPDHGTAFEIAGKGIAEESSFRNALYLALEVVKNRKQAAELEDGALIVNKSRN